MIDHTLIERTLAILEEVARREGAMPVLDSIRNQLKFLAAYNPSSEADRTRIKDIILGVQAAREVETIDMTLADMLHDVSAQVRAELSSQNTGLGN